MDDNLKIFSVKELMTIGNFLALDLKYSPEFDNRSQLLSDILLELEKRNAINRLDAAAAHKSLQTADFKGISLFRPDMKSVSDEKVNAFLREKMKNFSLVINWTKYKTRKG